jgi:hypothetical protein
MYNERPFSLLAATLYLALGFLLLDVAHGWWRYAAIALMMLLYLPMFFMYRDEFFAVEDWIVRQFARLRRRSRGQ